MGFADCRDLLRKRVIEPAPARIQLLTGPRQVGKTTLLLGLADGSPGRTVYAAGDAPEQALPGAWERIWVQAEQIAEAADGCIVLLDEVQHFHEWSSRLKGEWDRLRRLRRKVHVVATGSSSLTLGRGSRESLAGRFERITISHWSARDLEQAFGLAPEDAAECSVLLGTYPGAFPLRDQSSRFAAYVRDAIVEPAITKDVIGLSDVRRPALLRQVFAVAASSPGQILSLQKIQGQLRDRGALETVAHYLHLLEDAYLVAAISKHSARGVRRRASPPKLVALNNAILSAVDPLGTPDPARDPARFGAWVENACLAFAWNSGQHVSYWREEPLEVDAIVEGRWGSWAIEVKVGGFDSGDLRGLLEFTKRSPKYTPLVVCRDEDVGRARRFGVSAVSWQQFLLDGPISSRRGGAVSIEGA
jgi:predicted AAA+ superfamily ATPase